MSFKSISSALEIEYDDGSNLDNPPTSIKEPNDDSCEYTDQEKDDFELARKSLINALDKSSTILDELTTLSKDTESPRAYEVCATLISTISNVSKQLVDLHNNKIKKSNKEKPAVVNNNMFVGTTQDLQKKIADLIKSKT